MFATRHRAALACAAVALLLSGCTDLDQAASAQGIARNDLVSELATRLAGSATRTFTAHYQLPGGARAAVSQAQNPPRASYTYPGGRLLVSEDAVTSCGKSCRVISRPGGGGALPPATYSDTERAGLVAPATVVALLNAAALHEAVRVQPRDTTIAGRHATCVQLSEVPDQRSRAFRTCVTGEGVLGSFTGTLDGRPVDMAMTEYAERVPAGAFDVPSATHAPAHLHVQQRPQVTRRR